MGDIDRPVGRLFLQMAKTQGGCKNIMKATNSFPFAINVSRCASCITIVLCLSVFESSHAAKIPLTPPAASTLRQLGDARHILMGTAVKSQLLDEPTYPEILASEFSQLQAEYEMKFGAIHPRPDTDPNPYDFAGGDKLVAFAEAHNMVVRGHTLVWHNSVPEWLKKGSFTPQQQSEILHKHIQTVMQHYAGKVYAWDVVNEAFNEDGTMRSTLWYDKPGIGAGTGTKYLEQAFRWAHEADPKAKLFYNDYDTEVENKKSDAIYEMAKDFKKRGVPLDGIGFQTHVSLKFDDPEKIKSYKKNLERFAKLGLELQMTEIDVRLDDSSAASLNAQAKVYGEITRLCVEQPACKAWQIWGFTDKHSWIPQFYKGHGWALLWDENYQKKPAYGAVREALKSEQSH
jgi:endo-1,4-beta-xylanase